MFAKLRQWWKNAKLGITYQDRLDWVGQVMTEIDKISTHPEVMAHLPEALERIKYLRNRNAIVLPSIIESDQLVLGHFTNSKSEHLTPLMIFPIIHSDSRISPIADYYRKHAQPGSYSPEGHLVVLGMDEQETLRFMATTLLHEVGHAMIVEKNERILSKSTVRDKQTRLKEELEMWLFDCRLAGFLGGEQLRSQINSTVEKIIQQWKKRSPVQVTIEDGAPLDLCYGAIPKKGSLGRRAMLYIRYCELVALNDYLPPDIAYQQQLLIIDTICQETYKNQEDIIGNLSNFQS